MSDMASAAAHGDAIDPTRGEVDDAVAHVMCEDALTFHEACRRRKEAARRLWSGEAPSVPVPIELACALCGERLYSTFSFARARVEGVICEGCAGMYQAVAEGPLLIDRLTIPDRRFRLLESPPAQSCTVAFEPPLELRLMVYSGDGDRPYLVGLEDPDDPGALGVSDVNGQPGVSGGTREDLVVCVADYWGDHYLSDVCEAAGLIRSGGWAVDPDEQQEAQERLTEYGQRVRIVSPPALPAIKKEEHYRRTSLAGFIRLWRRRERG